MNFEYEKIKRILEFIKEKTNFVPDIGLVLGSGLGDFVEDIKVEFIIDYDKIPEFPQSTVSGHQGRFVFGLIDDVKVICMQGRIHYYEGYAMSEVVLAIRIMKLLGAKILFLTNAAGGINDSFQPGDLMLIKDHISCFVPNPLIGQNIEELGPRFPDMSKVYDPALQEVIKEVARKLDIPLKEGVYIQYSGPAYETPAEIKFFKNLGADAVGMSTAVEAIAARHAGMRIAGLSCITNLAAGLSSAPLSHEDVQKIASQTSEKFKNLVQDSIINFKNR
jgi:purine-nucleoside phosphorylase